MDWVNILLVSFSLSIDAMTANAANGIKEKGMSIWKMLAIAFVFGAFQFLMPLLGYLIGFKFEKYLEAWIPWIAFALLSFLAIKSFIDWLKDRKQAKKGISKKEIVSPNEIFVQGIATSIDALCIGFVYLSSSLSEALLIFGIIGITTFILSFLSALLAKQVASKLERWSGLIATIVFLALGIKILLEGIL